MDEKFDHEDCIDTECDVCPKCGLRFQYLSGQRYCPTCEYDEFSDYGENDLPDVE